MGHKGEAGYLKRGTWMTLGLLKRHRDEVMTPWRRGPALQQRKGVAP